jgi:hypothetical protein
MLTTPPSPPTNPPPPPRNAFLIVRKPDFFVNFGQFPCSWNRIQIRIPNTDGSGSRTAKLMLTMRIRIKNIEKSYLILAAETSAAGLFSLSSLEKCQIKIFIYQFSSTSDIVKSALFPLNFYFF